MKIRIFLIVLKLLQICYGCLESNFTKNNEYPSCPFSVIRSKRALSEYTRWTSNEPTKPEFIVKVEDDMIPTTTPNQIMAINIQQEPKSHEKIIIGGVMIPTARTILPTTELPAEYTRFVPPTTVRVAQLDGDLYLAPALSPAVQSSKGTMYQPPLPKLAAKYPQRDKSRPAVPRLIPRPPSLIPRQYAAITNVAFLPRATPSHSNSPPLTLPTTPQPILRISIRHLSRTSPLPDETPTRTESISEVMKLFQPVVEDINSLESFFTLDNDDKQSDVPQIPSTHLFNTELVMSETPLNGNERDKMNGVPTKKTTLTTSLDSAYNMMYSETSFNVNERDEMGGVPTKITTLTTSLDPSYNMMYYDEDDILVGTTKKDDQDYGISRKKYEKVSGNIKTEGEENPNHIENFNGDYADSMTSVEDLKTQNYKDDKSLAENRLDETIADNNASTTPEAKQVTSQKSVRAKRRPVCNLLKLRELNFESPRTLPEIVLQLKKWADESPIAKWVDITYDNFTTMENPIYLMIIDDPSSGQAVTAKQTVMIVAGIQGRDHHAVTAALYVLYQLIERSQLHSELLSKFRFWVIPVFNPDGYDYSMSFPQRREWTKNLHQSWEPCRGRESRSACDTHGLRCTVRACYGVNLDRNFEYQWIPTITDGCYVLSNQDNTLDLHKSRYAEIYEDKCNILIAEELRAEHPCGDLYAGTRQLCEIETRALTRYLHDQRTPLHTFIAFKEGTLLGVMYPYSHTRKRRAFDHVYRQRASRAAAAAYSISGRPFVAGQTSEFLPLYAGGIEDWVDGHLGIDNTYTIMVFGPTDTNNPKLMTQRVVHEAFAATDTLLLQSLETHSPQMFHHVRAGAPRQAPGPMIFLAILKILST